MSLSLIASLVLAVVFGLAGTQKLGDLDASRDAVEHFGVPRRLAPVVGFLLPLGELGLAFALLVPRTAFWAAIGAVALLLVFSTAVAVAIRRGTGGTCNCFGSMTSSPVGGRMLARNGALIALATVAAAAEQTGIGTIPGGAWVVAGAIAAVVVAAQSFFLWQLFLQNGRLLARVDALELSSLEAPSPSSLPLGADAPAFVLPDLDGRRHSLHELLHAERGALLVFTDPACGHCTPLLPLVASMQHDGSVPVALISSGDPHANREKAEQHGLARVLLQQADEVADLYHVHGAPSAVLVDGAGRIASERAEGLRAVRALLPRATGRPEAAVAAL